MLALNSCENEPGRTVQVVNYGPFSSETLRDAKFGVIRFVISVF
jgi:hypothetical protein